MFKKQYLISAFKLCFLFSAAFCIGTMTAHLQKQQSLKAIPTAADGNWGLSFPKKEKHQLGMPPPENFQNTMHFMLEIPIRK